MLELLPALPADGEDSDLLSSTAAVGGATADAAQPGAVEARPATAAGGRGKGGKGGKGKPKRSRGAKKGAKKG